MDALIDSIPDPVRRAVRRSVIDHGVEAPEFGGAYAAHVKLFDLVDATLAERPFLVGDAYSLADAALTPYVIRVDHLRLTATQRIQLQDLFRQFLLLAQKPLPDFSEILQEPVESKVDGKRLFGIIQRMLHVPNVSGCMEKDCHV